MQAGALYADESTSCTPNALDTSTSNGSVWEVGVGCQYNPSTWTAGSIPDRVLQLKETPQAHGVSLSLASARPCPAPMSTRHLQRYRARRQRPVNRVPLQLGHFCSHTDLFAKLCRE